jgi:hypothetical protein
MATKPPALKRDLHVVTVAQIGLLTAVMVCGAGCAELARILVPWIGVHSTATLGFEEALTVTVDTGHNGRALIGAMMLTESAKRAIRALRQRELADDELAEMIAPLMSQIREELK